MSRLFNLNLDINILCIDNSTSIVNQNNVNFKNFYYVKMETNVGISKAYNAAINYLKSLFLDNDDLIVLLDDDTLITKEYFDELIFDAKNNSDYKIFTPIIVGQDGKIYSPNEYRFFKNKKLKNPNQLINQRRYNAINSCMAIKYSVLRDYKYDEKLFLDQVDHKFCFDQRKRGNKFFQMKVIIHHNFSLKENKKSEDAILSRYKIMVPDFLYFSYMTNRLFLGKIKVLLWGIREGWRSKSFNLLKRIISYMRGMRF